jgi:hypothetical protein
MNVAVGMVMAVFLFMLMRMALIAVVLAIMPGVFFVSVRHGHRAASGRNKCKMQIAEFKLQN